MINSLVAIAPQKVSNWAHRQFLCLGRSLRAALVVYNYSFKHKNINHEYRFRNGSGEDFALCRQLPLLES